MNYSHEHPTVAFDAMGNPIILGAIYGYSQNSNGHTTASVGYARKINEKSISIEVIRKFSSSYTDRPKEHSGPHRGIATKANMLFRLHEDTLDYNNQISNF
jgi:hypothetical protein